MVFKTFLLFFLISKSLTSPFFVPINAANRKSISEIQLTNIGKYGLVRKARKTVPSHLHTGIDIKRPSKNYTNEPIYSIANGTVISKRTDGPYAQLIIEHHFDNKNFWTVYEHIAGITVDLNESVTPDKPIARFMNKEELNKHGWQFDHFHLEILKTKPIRIQPNKLHPTRLYNSFSLVCFTSEDLEKHYYNIRKSPLK
jgi:murein DD-endopeptidase MepM/ murein hydrolase activator NlpD